MNAVDEFIVYDNIEFTKKGWINRNRILVNGKDTFITLPLKKGSDYLNVNERYLAESWLTERTKLMNRVTEAYRKAPQFSLAYPVIKKSIFFEDLNLFNFIFHSLDTIKQYLEISTPLVISSSVTIDHGMKSEKKVIELCKARQTTKYINPIGGITLYDKAEFRKEGIELGFLKSNDIIYNQYNNEFIPWLSIIDVIMFNSKEKIKDYLNSFYTII
jgi:hypothetical protein